MKFINFSAILFLACLITISSCTNDDNLEIVTLKVNHFKQSGNALMPNQFLLVQAEEAIDGNDWYLLYDGIKSFNYELGYVYTLKAEMEFIGNLAADDGSVKYRLIELISKEKASSDISFEILLARNYNDNYFEPFFTKTDNSTFALLDGTQIDCSNFCDELTEKLSAKEDITGVFKHSDANELLLIELK